MKTEEQRRKALIVDLEFYFEDTLKLLGKSNVIDGSAYAILGVPFDFTSTYRQALDLRLLLYEKLQIT